MFIYLRVYIHKYFIHIVFGDVCRSSGMCLSAVLIKFTNYIYLNDNNQSLDDLPKHQMFAYAASLIGRLDAYFADEKSHFPRDIHDIHQVLEYLNLASSRSLPAELLKVILYHADYDCLHFTASADHEMNAISRNQNGPPAKSYVETGPLTSLASSASFAHPDRATISTPKGRIRSMHLKFTGRDQGWASDPNTASWSWFEIAKKRFNQDRVHRGPVLVHNSVAGRDWEDHEIYYHADEQVPQRGVTEELKQWIAELRAEDRVAIVPMSQYGGWQCRVSKASIDIEVELWY